MYVSYHYMSHSFVYSYIFTECATIHFPPSIEALCTSDQSCNGIGCCIELDLGVIRRTFSVWMKIDTCEKIFSVGFEKWVNREALHTGSGS